MPFADYVSRSVLIATPDKQEFEGIKGSLTSRFGPAVVIQEAPTMEEFARQFTEGYDLAIVNVGLARVPDGANGYIPRLLPLLDQPRNPVIITCDEEPGLEGKLKSLGVNLLGVLAQPKHPEEQSTYLKRLSDEVFNGLTRGVRTKQRYDGTIGIMGVGRLGGGLAHRIIQAPPSAVECILLYNGEEPEKVERAGYMRQQLKSAAEQERKQILVEVATPQMINLLASRPTITIGKREMEARAPDISTHLDAYLDPIISLGKQFRGNTHATFLVGTNPVDHLAYVLSSIMRNGQREPHLEALIGPDYERALAVLRSYAERHRLPIDTRGVDAVLIGPHHEEQIVFAHIGGFGLEAMSVETGEVLSTQIMKAEMMKLGFGAYNLTGGELTGANPDLWLYRQLMATYPRVARSIIPGITHLTIEELVREVGNIRVPRQNRCHGEKKTERLAYHLARFFPRGIYTGWLVQHDSFGHPNPASLTGPTGARLKITKSQREPFINSLRRVRKEVIRSVRKKIEEGGPHQEEYRTILGDLNALS